MIWVMDSQPQRIALKQYSQFNVGDLVRVTKKPALYEELKKSYVSWANLVDKILEEGTIIEVTRIRPEPWKGHIWIHFKGEFSTSYAMPEDALEAVFTT